MANAIGCATIFLRFGGRTSKALRSRMWRSVTRTSAKLRTSRNAISLALPASTIAFSIVTRSSSRFFSAPRGCDASNKSPSLPVGAHYQVGSHLRAHAKAPFVGQPYSQAHPSLSRSIRL